MNEYRTFTYAVTFKSAEQRDKALPETQKAFDDILQALREGFVVLYSHPVGTANASIHVFMVRTL